MVGVQGGWSEGWQETDEDDTIPEDNIRRHIGKTRRHHPRGEGGSVQTQGCDNVAGIKTMLLDSRSMDSTHRR